MKYALLIILLLLTSCSRIVLLSRSDDSIEKAIKNMNAVGKDRPCKITLQNGYSFTTDSLEIKNDTLFYRLAETDTNSSIPFSNVTSFYYRDHSDGFFSGGLISAAIGFSIGFVFLSDLPNVGGGSTHSPLTGGCCMSALGFGLGGAVVSIKGVERQYELPDSLQSDSLYLSQ